MGIKAQPITLKTSKNRTYHSGRSAMTIVLFTTISSDWSKKANSLDAQQEKHVTITDVSKYDTATA